MATPPRLGRGDPAPSYIRWIHEDVLALLGDAISKRLPEQPDTVEPLISPAKPFEIPSSLIKGFYAIIGLQIVTAILLLIVIIK